MIYFYRYKILLRQFVVVLYKIIKLYQAASENVQGARYKFNNIQVKVEETGLPPIGKIDLSTR